MICCFTSSLMSCSYSRKHVQLYMFLILWQGAMCLSHIVLHPTCFSPYGSFHGTYCFIFNLSCAMNSIYRVHSSIVVQSNVHQYKEFRNLYAQFEGEFILYVVIMRLTCFQVYLFQSHGVFWLSPRRYAYELIFTSNSCLNLLYLLRYLP